MLPVLLFFAFVARSQDHMRLAGYVEMSSQPIADYYLEISIKNGEVNGYSVTGYKSGNRLKAKVVGRMPTASELYIEEVQTGQEGPGIFCYFKAILKLSIYKTTRRWSGSFESRQSNGLVCGMGLMTVMDNAPPLEAIPIGVTAKSAPPPAQGRMKVQQEPGVPSQAAKPVIPKDTAAKKTKIETAAPPPPKPKTAVIVAAAKPPAVPQISLNNCLKSVEWASDNLRLEIWDGKIIDGDVVSVSWNGQLILDRKKLDASHLAFPLTLKKGLNILEIQMFDEGFEAGNSPDIILSDGNRNLPLHISGDNGDRARICVEQVH